MNPPNNDPRCPSFDELRGWFVDALYFKRVQSISVGVHIDSELWEVPGRITRFKGMLTVTVGPFFLEFGG